MYGDSNVKDKTVANIFKVRWPPSFNESFNKKFNIVAPILRGWWWVVVVVVVGWGGGGGGGGGVVVGVGGGGGGGVVVGVGGNFHDRKVSDTFEWAMPAKSLFL